MSVIQYKTQMRKEKIVVADGPSALSEAVERHFNAGAVEIRLVGDKSMILSSSRPWSVEAKYYEKEEK